MEELWELFLLRSERTFERKSVMPLTIIDGAVTGNSIGETLDVAQTIETMKDP